MSQSMDAREAEGKSMHEVLQVLGATETGLDGDEAARRLARDGANRLEEKRTPAWQKLLRNFWGPIPWMIEVAAALSAAVGDWADFAIIMVMLALNALISFWQEHKADDAIDMLRRELALDAMVRRDGRWSELPAAELVAGDLVRVRLGDVVPASAA